MTKSHAEENLVQKTEGTNKITQSIKEAIEETFSSVPALCGGSIRYLTKCLQEKVDKMH